MQRYERQRQRPDYQVLGLTHHRGREASVDVKGDRIIWTHHQEAKIERTPTTGWAMGGKEEYGERKTENRRIQANQDGAPAGNLRRGRKRNNGLR